MEKKKSMIKLVGAFALNFLWYSVLAYFIFWGINCGLIFLFNKVIVSLPVPIIKGFAIFIAFIYPSIISWVSNFFCLSRSYKFISRKYSIDDINKMIYSCFALYTLFIIVYEIISFVLSKNTSLIASCITILFNIVFYLCLIPYLKSIINHFMSLKVGGKDVIINDTLNKDVIDVSSDDYSSFSSADLIKPDYAMTQINNEKNEEYNNGFMGEQVNHFIIDDAVNNGEIKETIINQKKEVPNIFTFDTINQDGSVVSTSSNVTSDGTKDESTGLHVTSGDSKDGSNILESDDSVMLGEIVSPVIALEPSQIETIANASKIDDSVIPESENKVFSNDNSIESSMINVEDISQEQDNMMSDIIQVEEEPDFIPQPDTISNDNVLINNHSLEIDVPNMESINSKSDNVNSVSKEVSQVEEISVSNNTSSNIWTDSSINGEDTNNSI